MSPDSESPPSPPPGLTRCLVVGRVENIPKAWLEGVRAGRGVVESVAHPLIAFAEALRHEVADRLRPSFGLARQESIAVVFADTASGGSDAELDSFAAAIRAHAPEVGVWTLVDGSPRRLATESRPAPDPARPPSLRLAGTDALPPAMTPDPGTEPLPPLEASIPPSATPSLTPGVTPSVTPEEIEMLLRFFDSDPDAAPDGPTGGGR